MLNSFVLVKNLRSKANELIFADFALYKIRSNWEYDLNRSQQLFPKAWPLNQDWIYIRKYENDNYWDTIPYDVEDTLLLFRLFKPGDLVFLQPCIENEKKELSCQLPYRAMANVRSANKYDLQPEDCTNFDKFAYEIKSLRNWSSVWFQTARRFFLYGGGKEFRPKHHQVDRIVDYFTALESILVSERDGFIGRRLRERATLLLDLKESDLDNTKRLLRDFYNVRSTIVHGSDISSIKIETLKKDFDLEEVVRQIILKALRVLPEGENERMSYLKSLFDVNDEDRAEQVFSDFCKIKDTNKKNKWTERIANRVLGSSSK
jgi:hypothetical protein